MKNRYLTCLLLACMASNAFASTYYVSTDSFGNPADGTSWATAFPGVQQAIDKAVSGDEIWVRTGTYTTSGLPNYNFLLKDGVKLYGGFAGGETSLDQRNVAMFPTRLSGEMGSARATHVVVSVNDGPATVLDGFTISGARGTLGGFTVEGQYIDHSAGGGIHIATGSPTIAHCLITDNTSDLGGGLFVFNAAPTITGTIFSNNLAYRGGGGILNISSNSVITNCVFVANTSYSEGSAISVRASSPVITSSTITGNISSTDGTAVYYAPAAGGILRNCILSNTTSLGTQLPIRSIIREPGGVLLTLHFNVIAGSRMPVSGGPLDDYSDNAADDPLFADTVVPAGNDGIWRTGDDGLRPAYISPARDAGTGTEPGTDITGKTRTGIMDIGAYEAIDRSTRYYVNQSANPNDGLSWSTGFQDIFLAMLKAVPGDEIWVKKGTYFPSSGPNRFLLLKNGVKIYGGFAGTETSLAERNIALNPTILSGNSPAGRSVHVVVSINDGAETVLDGFTISGARGARGTVIVEGATIDSNSGAGMYIADGNPVISQCTFTDNIAEKGGGIFISNVSPSITHSLFNGNQASLGDGGGIFNVYSNAVINNCLFYTNSSSGAGGAIANAAGNPLISSCTLVGNKAATGPGISFGFNSGGSLTNSIVYKNTRTGYPANGEAQIQKADANGQLIVSHNIVTSPNAQFTLANVPSENLTNNSTTDPRFADALNPAGIDGYWLTEDDGLRPAYNSPAKDAGTGNEPLTDISGAARSGALDLGAYEALMSGKRYYVDASRFSIVGTSWTEPFPNLTFALSRAVSGDEIWVRRGTYNGFSPGSYVLLLKDGVKIYGGFAGDETALEQRNLTLNPTILNGIPGTSVHVVLSVNDGPGTLLDGFTISGGRKSTGSVMVEDQQIENNYGAGVYIHSGSPAINNCVITDNAAEAGGGMYNTNANPLITNTVFTNNKTEPGSGNGHGGGMYNQFSKPVITNCVFNGNVSRNAGGAIFNEFSSPAISNTTITNNTASQYGTAISYSSQSGGTLQNSIIYRNVTTGIPFGAQSQIHKINTDNNLTVNFNIITSPEAQVSIQGVPSENLISNSTADPRLADPVNPAGADGIWGTGDDGLRPAFNSPAKDAGTGNAPAADILGKIRVGAMDLGAYESIERGIRYYVQQFGRGGAGTSWSTAFSNIQEAIYKAVSGDEIWVKSGTYSPFRPFNWPVTRDADATFYLKNGVKLYGGFAGTEHLLDQRSVGTNETVLSGAMPGPAHVVLSVADGPETVLDGFTISGGRRTSGLLTVEGNVVQSAYGAGMYIAAGSPTIRNCVFTGNAADQGGGMFNDNASPVLTNVVFSSNTAAFGGGGGMYNQASNPVISNAVFHANTSQYAGGAILNSGSRPVIENSTFFKNLSAGDGSAVYYGYQSGGTLKNTVLYQNARTGNPANIADQVYVETDLGNVTITHSIITNPDGLRTVTNVSPEKQISISTADPLFSNANYPAGGDGRWLTADDGLRINCDSPAKDAGEAGQLAKDILGNTQNGRPDIGAYESMNASASTAISNVNTIVKQVQVIGIWDYSSCDGQLLRITGGSNYSIFGDVTAKVWKDAVQPATYVKRHYEITLAFNADFASARVTLFFSDQEMTDYNAVNAVKLPVSTLTGREMDQAKANLRIQKRQGPGDADGAPASYPGSPTEIDPADADIVWNAAASRWEVSFIVVGFSGFFVTSVQTPLPLRLIAFSGQRSEGRNQLDWKTADEVNTSHFEVQRSLNAHRFETIGTIAAAASGNHQYAFEDPFPDAGRAYYRLKMSDLDGSYTYSKIITLNADAATAIAVFPNPVTSVVYTEVTRNLVNTRAFVYNTQGRLVQVWDITATAQEHKAAALPEGVYLIRFADDTTRKFVKH